jgi:hypothetical protein
MPDLKLFICTDHSGFYPVGTASIIIAPDEEEARKLLDAALTARGLFPIEYYTLQEVDLDKPTAYILRDGNY